MSAGGEKRRALSVVVMCRHGVFTHRAENDGTIVVGRGDDCDVTLDDAELSRRHASIAIEEGAATITDLGSSNGTALNGHRLPPREPHPFARGDVVTAGATTIRLEEVLSPRAILSRRAFEEACDAALAVSIRERTSITLARIYVDVPRAHAADLATHDEKLREVVRWRESVLAAIDQALGERDELSAVEPGVFDVLFVAPHTGAEVTAALERAMPQTDLEVDIARFPDDAPSREGLLAVLDGDRQPATGAAPVSPTSRLGPLVNRIAAGPLNVLVIGETGVGKDVMARALHERSPRATKPLVCLNCAAFSEALLESELFGHEKGAFTGAIAAKPGLIESADGGTVFLDEIGDLPLSLQATLLRAIEQREVQRIGALRPRIVDVRFVAATNRDLEADGAAGRFRTDLYYRLAGFVVRVPPLRDRRDEIPGLAHAFVAETCARAGRAVIPELTLPVLEVLAKYDYPGNVRELKNIIARAVVLCDGDRISLEHIALLPTDRAGDLFRSPTTDSPPADERARIQWALDRTGGHQSKAAALLGISRRTLINRLDEFGLPRPRKRTT